MIHGLLSSQCSSGSGWLQGVVDGAGGSGEVQASSHRDAQDRDTRLGQPLAWPTRISYLSGLRLVVTSRRGGLGDGKAALERGHDSASSAAAHRPKTAPVHAHKLPLSNARSHGARRGGDIQPSLHCPLPPDTFTLSAA